MTTAIFLTNNELPESWVNFHRKTLLEAHQGPIITVSRKPMPEYKINLIQTEPKSPSNIYRQLLRACHVAETKHIAVVEDDTLYPADHFKYEPQKVSYNQAHWSLYSWDPSVFSWRNRRGNYSMVAPRALVIEALEERFAKYPNGTPDRITGEIGRHMVERNMGITLREVEEFFTNIPIVNLNHDYATDTLQRNHRKRHGELRVKELPKWGRPLDILAHLK